MTASETARPDTSTFYSWYVVGLLSLTHLVSFIDRFVLSLVFVPLKAALNLSDTQLGMVQGLGFVILYSVAGIPLGRLADVASRRMMIAAGMLIWSLATAACALAHDFPGLFAARIVVGFGEAALVPAAMSLISGYFRRGHLARAVSVFTMGAPLGKTVALIAGGWLLALMAPAAGIDLPLLGHFEPWQALFLAASLPGLLLLPLVLTIGNPSRGPVSLVREDKFASALRHIRLNLRAYAAHIGTACCGILLVQAFGAWSPSLFVRMHGLSVAQSGYVVGMATVAASPLGNLVGGWATDRLSARGLFSAPLIVMATSLALAVPVALLLSAAPGWLSAAIAFGVLMFLLSCTSGPALAGLQMLTPAHQRGATTAIYMCIMTVVSVGLGPTIVGVLSDNVFGGGRGLGMALTVTTIVIALLGIASACAGRATVGKVSQILEEASVA
jgi:MFS family permease